MPIYGEGDIIYICYSMLAVQCKYICVLKREKNYLKIQPVNMTIITIQYDKGKSKNH